MAQGTVMHHCEVALADADRGVYETLELALARHPSETLEYLVTRLLAYGLEYCEGIRFAGGGVSDPSAPPISAQALDGTLTLWVEIGLPAADRLHKAAKAAARVAVYTHRDPQLLLRQLAGERIHRAEQIALYALGGELIEPLCAGFTRRNQLELTRSDGELYLSLNGVHFNGRAQRLELS